MKSSLLHNDSLTPGGSQRPPPFAPQSASAPPMEMEPSCGTYSSNRCCNNVGRAPQGFASPEDIWENRQENMNRQQTVVHQTIYVQAPDRDRRYARWENTPVIIYAEPKESICCPLLLFILGFTFPILWLFGCCYVSAKTARVRFLGRVSLFAFILVTATSLTVALHFNARTGGWPWNACFWSGSKC
mmetsp:Transcript_84221/g.225145  ORF Transcript_84221/g.225145 Transcript_84221/m.225145 type:complete len:187 (+) Transcript_84221:119-679(+)